MRFSGFSLFTLLSLVTLAQADTNCAATDDEGTPLLDKGVDGTFFTCTYKGARLCTYFSDGSFSSGASICPPGLPQDTSGSGSTSSSSAAPQTSATSAIVQTSAAVTSAPVTSTDNASTSAPLTSTSAPLTATSTPATSATTPVTSAPSSTTDVPITVPSSGALPAVHRSAFLTVAAIVAGVVLG
ncbi:hypothetical protein C8J56DRAFT_909406 [Mycena floridula]|nr:hypothetical protein C8J56DRAFT_909406 [Mycena floridula]